MASLVRVLFTTDSFLKQRPVQASELPSNELQKIPAGTQLVLQSYSEPDSNKHYKLSLNNLQFKGTNMNWYAFAEHIIISNKSFTPAKTIQALGASKTDKNVVGIYANRKTIINKQSFLKIVFNVDTILKRDPISGDRLTDLSKQNIPAGTELVLLTNSPDTSGLVKLPLKDRHVKVSLKDIEFKGFSKDWYVFVEHAGIQQIVI